MPDRLADHVHKKLTQRLAYYEDLGIKLFYRTRSASGSGAETVEANPYSIPAIPIEETLPKAPTPKSPTKATIPATSPAIAALDRKSVV